MSRFKNIFWYMYKFIHVTVTVTAFLLITSLYSVSVYETLAFVDRYVDM